MKPDSFDMDMLAIKRETYEGEEMPSSSRIGKDGELEAAKALSVIAPIRRIKRPDYGISDMDLEMQPIGFAHLLWEIKTDKGKWSSKHAAALETFEATLAGEEYYVFHFPIFVAIVQARMGGERLPSWRASLAKPLKGYLHMLAQPEMYAERQREELPVYPVLMMQLRQGKGRPWARHVAMGYRYFKDMIGESNE